MPSIELTKLKACIFRTQDLLTNGIPKELDEHTCFITNCYTYALGILYKGEKNFSLNPGFTEDLFFWGNSSEELLNNIYVDLKNLNIKFRKINLDEDIKLSKHEYLVKIFYAPPNENQRRGDFHFIRQEPHKQYWFHKVGIDNQPEIIQPYDNCLYFEPFEPDEINCMAFKDSPYTLEPVAYLAIKEPIHKKTSKKHKN